MNPFLFSNDDFSTGTTSASGPVSGLGLAVRFVSGRFVPEGTDSLWGVVDVCRFLRCSRATVDRKVRQARAGKNHFPKPITAPGESLRWRKEDVVAYDESEPSEAPIQETAIQRNRRLEQARTRLRKLGIDVLKTKQSKD